MRWGIFLASALALAGCTTRLVHDSFNDQKTIEHSGLVYALPKQKITVEYEFILTKCHDHIKTGPKSSDLQYGAFDFRRTAKVTVATDADWSQRYVVPYEALQRGNKATTFSATLYDNGTIKTVGAHFDDRTAEIASNVIKSAASIVKMGIFDTSGLVSTKQTCTDEAITALRRIKSLKDKLASDDPILTDKQRASAESALQRNIASITIKKRTTLHPKWKSRPSGLNAATVDLKLFEGLEKQISHDEEDFHHLVLSGVWGDLDVNDKRKILLTTICLKAGRDVAREMAGPEYCGNLIMPDERTQTYRKPNEGVIYRDPLLVNVTVCKGDCVNGKKIAVTPAFIAQIGPERRLTLVSRPFQDGNVSATFAADGRMTSITHGSSAALEALSGVVANATGAAQTAYSDRETRETSAAKAEFELYKAQADAIEQKRRYEKLEAEEAQESADEAEE